MLSLGLVTLSLTLMVYGQTYSATYLPSNAPKQSEKGQTGTNQCGSGHDQNSNCQNVYVNSVDDFCLFAPPEPGPGSLIGNTERIEVAWCIKDGYGTRLIPDGTILGAHFVQTPDYVQVTGIGDLTKINVPKGDAGGELDPHGADGNGNPIGGLVFSSAFGQLQQIHEWTNFMSDSEFCIRACKDGPKAPALCQHIYDVMGCHWNMPGNYNAGTFEKCAADSGEPMGVYGGSTFHQGEAVTPAPHPAPSSSQCVTVSTIGNNLAASSSANATSVSSSVASSSGSSAPSSASSGVSSSPSASSAAPGSGISSTPAVTSTSPSSATRSSSGSGTPSATGGANTNGASALQAASVAGLALSALAAVGGALLI